jgi:protein transport protein SEC31
MPNMTPQQPSIPTPSAMAAPAPAPMTHQMSPQMSHQNQMSHPMGIPPANMTSSNFSQKNQIQPAEPQGPNSGAAKVQKLPLPDQFVPIQKSFDAALQRCQSVPNINASIKKKLDDTNKRLSSLYDKLRNNTLSKIVTDGLIQIAEALDVNDYSRGLGLVQWIVQKANFSEVSSFLPGIKNLMQIANQLKV